MPNGKTQNYKLNQWEKTDKVLMEDFNADNLAIDTALAAEKSARETAVKAETTARTSAIVSLNTALGKRGNCQMWVYTYKGNGQYGADHPISITFPEKPDVIILFQENARWDQVLAVNTPNFYCTNATAPITWSGNTMRWYASTAAAQLNESGITYKVVGFWTK